MKNCPASPTAEVGVWYREHHGWLRNWLRAKVGRPEDADELAQDTFVRVLCAHLRQQDELREPRAYLVTVAGRLVSNFYRRQSIERAYLEVLAALPPQSQPSLETQALMRESLFEFDSMLDGLGSKVKQAFIMAQFQGLPYVEIAARLNISLRSVSTYVARAMAHCCLMLP
ncbi:RNA polymerase sigma-70 factor (ECF subfamily) [Kerstersia gyiorum]|uniref:RNA polymerase sigma factor n=1 Tax=Kerstersia gyiorum TaxID=206506 RepID=A0A4Q7MRR2_9BURK|nr:sigma-70 family RNA polymerase sigma factor [Kerstersia gyiorum]KAB0543218.1 sigma-70 family RNA polymerase sigma factor [Kerstersia gyiorum]RZS70481.1 RNA polymerase sigma-70 factor (ECF subfamily) [Kerstersia gyiorum]